MSLVRLLTTGKSLVGLKDSESRYRVTTQRLLPKFGSRRNPFGSPVKVPTEHPQESGTQGCTNLAKVPTETTPSEQSSSPAEPKTAIGPEQESGKRRFRSFAEFCAAICSAVKFWNRPRAAKPALPVFAKTPVQAELSLEGVRVVRNDLSDSDVEIVTRSPMVAKPGAAIPAGPEKAPVGSGCDEVTGTLLRSGKG